MVEPNDPPAPEPATTSLGSEGAAPPEAAPHRLTATTPYQTTPEGTSLGERVTVGAQREATGEGTPTWPRPASGRVGMYELLEELPPGGMGQVYRARHMQLGHVVALKTVRADAGQDSSRAQRFRREAQAVANLDHRHIIRIQEYGEQDGRHYFTMKFAACGSLSQHRARFQADRRLAVSLVAKVARAVHHAHQRGILHRDLKPGNILLDEADEPLISDFGLAKLSQSDELTRTGEILGTPAYMSPEQAAGRNEQVTVASDVWSLGVVLFELVVGRRPFVGKDHEQVRVAILQNAVPRPRSLRREIDPSLEAVILHCLEEDPHQRYPTAEALADDLDNWLAGRPTAARPEFALQRIGRWIRRRPWVAALALVALAGLVSVAGLAYYRDPERPRRTIERDLARGQRVVLVGQTGPPRWWRWPITQGVFSRTALGPNQSFAVHAPTEFCLLELVADPQVSSYRFSAEIQQDQTTAGTDIGIYWARTAVGPNHLACSFTFNDMALLAHQFPQLNVKGNIAFYNVRVFDLKRDALRQHHLLHHLFKPAGMAGERPWRTLAAEVRPEEVRLFWEGKQVARTPTDELTKVAKSLLTIGVPLDTTEAAFSARGGLGLYVHDGEASFRNVVVEPLSGGQ